MSRKSGSDRELLDLAYAVEVDLAMLPVDLLSATALEAAHLRDLTRNMRRLAELVDALAKSLEETRNQES